MSARPAQCRHCLKPLSITDRLGDCCARAECRVAAAREAGRAVAAAQAKSDERLRQQMAGPAAIREPTRFPVHRLPAQRQRLVAQSADRISTIRRHLESIASEASAVPSPLIVSSLSIEDGESPAAIGAAGESLESACNAACALCAGDCCLTGEARLAYLTADTIRRFLSARPGTGVRDVVTEYLSRLPRSVTDGGCFFQGRRGCTLPRDMRSDVCNAYFCDELKTLRATVLDDDTNHVNAPVRAFFVVTLPDGRRQARFHEAAP